MSDVLVNLYTPRKTLDVLCLSNKVLTEDEDGQETRHLTFALPDHSLRWLSGQSVGVIAPGENKKGRAHAPRLYSIASAYDSDRKQNILSLSVKRVIFQNENGELVKGVASNFLCDLEEGESAHFTGPLGRHFLLDRNIGSKYIMMATGTGVAPFRAFIEEVLQKGGAKPFLWLILGIRDEKHLLYKDEFEALAKEYPEIFKFDFVYSHQNLPKGEKPKFIGDYLFEHKETFWQWMNDPEARAFLCGIKGMEEGVDRLMTILGKRKGFDWLAEKPEWVKNKKWMKEVY